MNHMNRKQESSALIAGVLVVVAILALCELAWLAFAASPAMAVVGSWIVVALVPFLIRIVTLRLLPKERTMLPH